MATTRTPLMAGNWKMNLDHHQATHTVQKLAWTLKDAKHDFGAVEVAVLPPFTDLRSVQTLVDADKLELVYGAQDVSAHESGAYTGEISPLFLAKLGVTYVAVGHSERREYHHEDDALVNAKVKSSLAAGLVPILCVGEPLEVRKAGEHVPHTLAQLDGALVGLSAEQVAGLVVAYEPVWAIGTGETATPEDAQELCAAIRVRIGELYDQATADAVRVLYGGSVKSSNVASIMAKPDVDGALVGGASLDPEEFAKIARYQSHQVG
ncbi:MULTISPECIES: triose-phosphate isomerase [Cellulomonas]|uniref:Triosephosphate isomerase n=1 Tax=Cellulomonas oligotrophica TaxID=931536 RepID=A0A7Y9FCQ3_9CELL|nr:MULTISPECIES: triose-phosphate isomerase [Cellulomonas]NYD84825.1 triosephosphate isomerase [Cellulomonas oligotrophica]TQL04083.1 triosephosphate isomerase [Cellulomonas sp. SLBN-39]GIG31894.1 triosephosphate isomerase [Cellulomonas oligotrophica]